MKKQILPILGLTTLLVAPVALADETEISPKPTAAEAISKSDIMFRADETEVDPDNPEVVDPTDPETPGIVKPDDSDGTSGNGNSSFNITWVSNFRFYDLNEKNERVGVKLNANGMNVWSKGTKLSLEKEDKEVKTYEDIPDAQFEFTITDNNDYHHTFLMNAYYNSYLSRANYLMNFSKLDESEVLINKAIEIKPNAPDAKQLLQKVNQLRTLSK